MTEKEVQNKENETLEFSKMFWIKTQGRNLGINGTVLLIFYPSWGQSEVVVETLRVVVDSLLRNVQRIVTLKGSHCRDDGPKETRVRRWLN